MKSAFRFFLLLFLLAPWKAKSLGVLAHEAVVDQLWDASLKPLLLAKYPGTTPEEMLKARAYAYGGAIVPDMGYFPFGSTRFSNLVHYVRSGDFVDALFEEAESLYQYAFALGVMTHYEADRVGHEHCTNKAVGMMFPKLSAKYGPAITYEQGTMPHSRMEFGFDVMQTARGNYATTAYHDFIGFEINDTVLAKAFRRTYGRELTDVFRSYSLAVSVFRFSVRKVIPELTRDAWKIKNSIITKANPLATKESYVYKVDRRKYRKEFKQPIIPSIFVTIFIAIIPKVSTFSHFKPQMPNEEAEALFEKSMDNIAGPCAARCSSLRRKDSVTLVNVNLDTGKKTKRGEYKLTDKTYYKLLMKLQKKDFESTDAALRENILTFYSEPGKKPLCRKKEKKIRKALAELGQVTAKPYSGE